MANDGVILLKPLECNQLDAIAELYNSSGDIQYATGISSPVSRLALRNRLSLLESSENEFLNGISLMDPGTASLDCQSRLIGIVSGILHEQALWIKAIAIFPQYRLLGIGSRAIELVLTFGKNCTGTKEAFLVTIEKNSIGKRFWHKQGFLEKGRFNKVLFDRELPDEVVIMQKSL